MHWAWRVSISLLSSIILRIEEFLLKAALLERLACGIAAIPFLNSDFTGIHLVLLLKATPVNQKKSVVGSSSFMVRAWRQQLVVKIIVIVSCDLEHSEAVPTIISVIVIEIKISLLVMQSHLKATFHGCY